MGKVEQIAAEEIAKSCDEWYEANKSDLQKYIDQGTPVWIVWDTWKAATMAVLTKLQGALADERQKALEDAAAIFDPYPWAALERVQVAAAIRQLKERT